MFPSSRKLQLLGTFIIHQDTDPKISAKATEMVSRHNGECSGPVKAQASV